MALGFAEIPAFSVMAVIADQTVKAAEVKILSIEATGYPTIVLKLEGDFQPSKPRWSLPNEWRSRWARRPRSM